MQGWNLTGQTNCFAVTDYLPVHGYLQSTIIVAGMLNMVSLQTNATSAFSKEREGNSCKLKKEFAGSKTLLTIDSLVLNIADNM